MVYAYPPNVMNKANKAGNDGGAAIKRRMTVRGGGDVAKEIDDKTMNKLLDLSTPEVEVDEPVNNGGNSGRGRSGSVDRMQRKATLQAEGKLGG